MICQWPLRQDPFRSGADVGHYYFISAKVVEVLQSVSGTDINPLCSSPLGQPDIVGVIANNKGPRKMHSEVPCRLMKKIGIRLDANAAIATAVGTDIDGGYL